MKIRLLILSFAVAAPLSAHDHFAVGITDANANGMPDSGESLRFADGDPEGKVFHLLARPVGQRGGGCYLLDEMPRTLFPADAFSITVQSDGQYDIKGTHHPATGSWIWAEIVSVSGPAGSRFGFWEPGVMTPTYLLDANEAVTDAAFVLSEGIDDSGEDPAGHIHGRAWTADTAGDYVVGIRLTDRSTNAPGGGPCHAPSRIYHFRFAAGPAFQPNIVRSINSVTLTWPSRMGIWADGGQSGVVFRVLRSPRPDGGWQPVGSVTGTTADTVFFTDFSAPTGSAFYRLAYDWATP
jgi:hypothetical protein